MRNKVAKKLRREATRLKLNYKSVKRFWKAVPRNAKTLEVLTLILEGAARINQAKKKGMQNEREIRMDA